MKNVSFMNDDFTGQVLITWFEGLSRGDKAVLKRCAGPEEIALTAQFHDLRIRLSGYSVNPARVALVVGILAFVKKNRESERFAVQMARDRSGKGKSPVSNLRFRKLLAIDDETELYHAMIRVIRILSGEVNIRSLGDAVYWWNSREKKQFATDYYENMVSS